MTDVRLSNTDLIREALCRSEALLARDAQARDSFPVEEILRELDVLPRSSIEIFERACSRYAARRALGERRDKGDALAFRPVSYAEVWDAITRLATNLQRERIAAEGDFVGIAGHGSLELAVADLACLYLGAVSVSLQTTFSRTDLLRVANETELTSIVCEKEWLLTAVSVLSACTSLRTVVVGGADEREDEGPLHEARAHLRRIASPIQIITAGQLMSDPGGPRAAMAVARGRADPLRSVMYTSGSSGVPKGVMFHESRWAEEWRPKNSDTFPFQHGLPRLPLITLLCAPLNHIMGRRLLGRSIVHGGLVHFLAKSDYSTLLQDLEITRPTYLYLVPRLADLIQQRCNTEMRSDDGLHARASDASVTLHERCRNRVLGDRILALGCSGGPLAPEVGRFFRDELRVPLYDVWGSTEIGGIAIDGQICRENIVDYKVVATSELGHDEAPLRPRGELRLKARRATQGYFKNPEATRQLVDEEGYIKTGDIVEEREPDNVKWIGRVNDVVKLAQGEFVTIWKLESAYSHGSSFIQQVYLHADSSRAYLVGVVVPRGAALRERLGDDPPPNTVKRLVKDELTRIAREHELRPFEAVRDFIVEVEPFTKENGLLTDASKPARPRLRAKYAEPLNALCERFDAGQGAEVAELHDLPLDAPVDLKVRHCLQAVLGLGEEELRGDVSFVALGGDSLDAVRFATLVEEATGVAVSPASILASTSLVRDLVNEIEGGAPRPGEGVRFESVHRSNADVDRAQVRLQNFLPAAELEAAHALTDRATLRPERFLLTGVSGFLGRFLLLELLEQLPRNGKVYCVVRSASDADAERRLAGVFRPQSPLASRYAELSRDRVVALRGDLVAPRFGLSESAFHELGAGVDAVLHCGALVNHAYSYANLFPPNVAGTAEVARFAVLGRRKSVVLISTSGVARNGTGVHPREDDDATLDRHPSDDTYAGGYFTSKWAAELLMRDVHASFGAPVGIVRCSSILAHREIAGEVNAADFVSHLLAGVARTGIAPATFYAEGARERHFDGLPVDFLARAIVRIATSPRLGCATYHAVNPHVADHVSIDRLVEWIGSYGYSLTRVASYEDWFHRFAVALDANGAGSQSSSRALLRRWERPAEADAVVLDGSAFRTRLAELTKEPVEIPHVTEALLHKMLRDLNELGVVPRP